MLYFHTTLYNGLEWLVDKGRLMEVGVFGFSKYYNRILNDKLYAARQLSISSTCNRDQWLCIDRVSWKVTCENRQWLQKNNDKLRE